MEEERGIAEPGEPKKLPRVFPEGIMRIFWGAVTGTVLNFGLFAGFTYLNGTPVPSARTPVALLNYPTGSWVTTLVVAFVMYFLSLLVSCVLIKR